MTGKMTPSAFNKVIDQDIEWLEKTVSENDKCSLLEYDHIINTLRYAAKQYSDNGKRIDDLTSHICMASLDFIGIALFAKSQLLQVRNK